MTRALSPPFETIAGPATARWVLTCDHASNRVPEEIGTLGLPDADMARHIAYDVGAAGVTRGLAARLNAPAVLSTFSRLVIDPNRGEDDPTLLMRLYDGSIIPANRHVDAHERERRLALYHRPYHNALAETLAATPHAAIVAIHSFTPQLKGRAPRPWHITLLFADADDRLSVPLLAGLSEEPDLCVGVNEPYHGHLPEDALHRHGLRTGRLHTLIEIRNDLIETPAQQAAWADRLAPLLERALTRLKEPLHG
jgi:predicted N-formylglutamate amidohydrolase